MPHKRKTRKEKEKATLRRTSSNMTVKSTNLPTYTLPKASMASKTQKEEVDTTSESSGSAIYLKHDIRNIIAAGGMVIAFDLVLYLLLSRGLIRLPFFGY